MDARTPHGALLSLFGILDAEDWRAGWRFSVYCYVGWYLHGQFSCH